MPPSPVVDALKHLSVVYASADVSIPDNDTSMPFVEYGSGISLLPLESEISTLTGHSNLNDKLLSFYFDVLTRTWIIA